VGGWRRWEAMTTDDHRPRPRTRRSRHNDRRRHRIPSCHSCRRQRLTVAGFGNKKLLRRRVPKVGIVRIVPLTPPQQSHKHCHNGGAICPSYGMVSMDTPDRTRVTSWEGVRQRRVDWV
jgi:hypothetical protein